MGGTRAPDTRYPGAFPGADSSSLRRAALREWWILAILLTLLAGALGWQNGLGRIDFTLYDATVAGLARAPSNDIVIIAIDEASLDQIGRWPWPRAVHGALLDKIKTAGPRAIAFDLILAEPEAGSGDTAFAQAIERAASGGPAASMGPAVPVVLAVLMEPAARGVIRTSLPVPQLAGAASALGHIHVELDADGLARSVFLLEGLVEANPGRSATWPHFALALKDAGFPQLAGEALPGERNPSSNATAGVWRRDHWIRIPFAGPPGTYTRLSYADVLRGKVPAAALAGKLVLVGATAAGLGDAYATPASGHGRAMPGIEIHANVIDALLHQRALVRAAPWSNALVSALLVFLAMLGLRRLSPRRGLLLIALLIPAVLAAVWALLAVAHVWFAPAACLIALGLGYPLWSWRRLEAAMRFLGDEFRRIQSEPAILPVARAGQGATPSGRTDLLDQRFSALETAAAQLRDTRRFVADTLNSHPEGTLVADTDGMILLANRAAAELFGTATPDALQGRNLDELMRHWTDRSAKTIPGLWATLTSDTRPETALELTTPGERHLIAHAARGTGSGGATLGWILSLIDVTALRSAEARRDEALAFLSHDMRSPQSSILALLELHSLDPDNYATDSVHARIEGYVRKTLDLSEQFLQLSSAETKDYEFRPVDPFELCSAAIDDTWEAALKKQITLTLRPAAPGDAALLLQADVALLTRAISNLLSNAVKYSPEGTQVSVTVTALPEAEVTAEVTTQFTPQVSMPDTGSATTSTMLKKPDAKTGASTITIEVADQGYGISETDQQQLFMRYRRFSTPGQPKAAGAGLGMVFVKTVTERHGGRIEFDSVPGQGTRFRLVLPAAGTTGD